MLTAIVLANSKAGKDERRLTEETARTLAFLVSAAVQGLVRDAVLVGENNAALRYVADYAGCTLVSEPDATQALAAALACARCEHVLLLKSGYACDAALIDEIRDFLEFGAGRNGRAGVIRAAANTPLQRIAPLTAPRVGVVALRSTCLALAARDLDDIVRRLRPAARLRTKARAILH